MHRILLWIYNNLKKCRLIISQQTCLSVFHWI